jgi:hypothetical protein
MLALAQSTSLTPTFAPAQTSRARKIGPGAVRRPGHPSYYNLGLLFGLKRWVKRSRLVHCLHDGEVFAGDLEGVGGHGTSSPSGNGTP